jgi:flagellar hook protein FlgE
MSILDASVSGMMANTNWLSTIAQNVANANTTGYKNVETEFASLVDSFFGRSQDFSGVTTSVRGLNSVQGSIIGTTTTTDMAVQGAGFFVVSNASGAMFLTRDGSFVPDAAGNLVNAAGYTLMGYNIQNGQSYGSSNSLSGMVKVNINSAGQTATPTTSGLLTANLPSTAAIVPAGKLPSTNTAGAIYTDKTSLVTYDNLGGAHTLDIYMTKTADNTWEVCVYDSADAAKGGGFPYSKGPLVTQTLTFSGTTGALTSGSPLSIPIPNGQTMSLDLSKTTQLASDFAVTAATANGNAPGSLSGVTISATGILSFNYSNGGSAPGFQIPLANVESPDNLAAVNGQAFQVNYASGPVFTGTAGSAGFGAIASSSLESSTVDLATELTQMIEAQSAYQANSKVFQTGAHILDVLNQLQP